MAITVTIDAVAKTTQVLHGTLDVDKRFASEYARLRIFDADSTSSAYRPDVDEALRGLHNSDLLLGGPIVRVSDERLGGDTGTVTVVEARDWTVLADRVFVPMQTFAAQGALTLVETLVDAYLADLGVTNISAATSGGPALPELVVDTPTATLREVLDRITAQCGWPWRINGDKQFALVEPGTLPGPVTLDTTNVLDGWTWQKESITNANRIFLQTSVPSTGAGPYEHTEHRTADGTMTIFPVNVLPSLIRGSVEVAGVATDTTLAIKGLPESAYLRVGARFTIEGHTTRYEVSAGLTTDADGTATVGLIVALEKATEVGTSLQFEPSAFVQLELDGVPTALAGAPWVWDGDRGALVNPSAAPTAGVVVTYRTWVTHPAWVRVWDAAVVTSVGGWDRTVLVDGVVDGNGHTDLSAAKAYGESVLTRKLLAPKRVRLRTFTSGWYPLLTATLSLGDRTVSGEYLVESVRIRDIGIDENATSNELVYELELLEGDDIRYSNAWIDYFRGLNPQAGIYWQAIQNDIFVSQAAIEAMVSHDVAHVSQAAVESMMRDATASAEISQAALEVMVA